MVEYIQKQDNLNKGRVKINNALTEANNNANKSKIDSAEALLKAIAAMDLSDSLREQLNQLVIQGDSSVEAAQARVDEKGQGHATLKDRIDDGFEKTTSQLAEKASISSVEKKADKTSLYEKFDYVTFNLNDSTIDFYANEELKTSVDISEAGNSQSVQNYIDSLVSEGLIEGITLSDDSINTAKIVNKAVNNNKLSDSYASVKRLFTSDDISQVKKEGIYYIPSGSIPAGKPSDILDQDTILEHRVYNHTSTVDITLQRITTVNKPQVEYIRIFSTDQDAGDFVLSKDKKKVTLTEKNISKITENGSYLGLSTTGHESVPPELAESSFLLDVTDFGYDGRFVIQTIYKTSGQINVSYKRFIQVATPENTVYGWIKDYSLIGGSGGKAYDQDLNTFDDVEFSTVTTEALEVSGEIPTGTLNNPPSGLISGDMWADTTDSNEYPVVRIML